MDSARDLYLTRRIGAVGSSLGTHTRPSGISSICTYTDSLLPLDIIYYNNIDDNDHVEEDLNIRKKERS